MVFLVVPGVLGMVFFLERMVFFLEHLSPLLFVIVMEALSKLLNRAVEWQYTEGFLVTSS